MSATCPQPPVETFHDGHGLLEQCGVDNRHVVLSLQCVKPWVVSVREAAALAEALDDALLNLGKHRQVCHSPGQVVGASVVDQPRGVLARQGIGARLRVVPHEPAVVIVFSHSRT